MGPAKLDKARAMGITLISETEFLNMIAGENSTPAGEGNQQSLF